MLRSSSEIGRTEYVGARFTMRDVRSRELIDSELRLLVLVRSAVLEHGGTAPGFDRIDELLEERAAMVTGEAAPWL